MKSLALLSVSSPFPALTSAPLVMLSAVEEELAFLSTLVFAAGAVREIPSPNVFVTVPNVTASTTAPVLRGPFLKATLLLLETVPPVLLSQSNVAESPLLHHRKYP